jgi:hypothetical protein
VAEPLQLSSSASRLAGIPNPGQWFRRGRPGKAALHASYRPLQRLILTATAAAQPRASTDMAGPVRVSASGPVRPAQFACAIRARRRLTLVKLFNWTGAIGHTLFQTLCALP